MTNPTPSPTPPTPELAELRTAAAQADELLTRTLEALREAALTVSSLSLVVANLQREAIDCEYETLEPRVRALIDGQLLQRTRFLTSRTADASTKLRDLADGVRYLRTHCTDLVALVPAPAATEDPTR